MAHCIFKNSNICLCLLVVALAAGCGKSPETKKADAFFRTWLGNHGETNVVLDSKGVGIAGNATRFHASIYETTQSANGYTAEVEFKIFIPESGPIVEYVAGVGETKDKAIGQAMVNFTLTTAHVVYKAFMNPADPHQRVKSVQINGKTREMFAGDMIQMGGGTNGSIDLSTMSEQTQDLVAAMPLAPGTHWVKLIYSQHDNKPMTVAATLDNNDAAEATTSLTNLKWPPRDDFYMVKQFIVVK